MIIIQSMNACSMFNGWRLKTWIIDIDLAMRSWILTTNTYATQMQIIEILDDKNCNNFEFEIWFIYKQTVEQGMSCEQFSKSIHLRDEKHVFLMKSLFRLQVTSVASRSRKLCKKEIIKQKEENQNWRKGEESCSVQAIHIRWERTFWNPKWARRKSDFILQILIEVKWDKSRNVKETLFTRTMHSTFNILHSFPFYNLCIVHKA